MIHTAVARLEAAALRLRTVLGAPVAAAAACDVGAPEQAWRAALDEELCDRLVDLAAARAWAAREAASGPDRHPAAAVLRGCTLWAVESDTARVLAMASTDASRPATDEAADAEVPSAVAAQGRAAALVTALASAEVYDAVCARLRTAFGPCPAGRAAAAWEIADTALSGLGATREEWVGTDPAYTAAGGWVLVDRIGRLALGAALLSATPTYPAVQAETRVNAARRHTWNHLRQPPPEAATAIHVRRTAELVDWIAGSAGRSGA
ncbi:hypothetical protein [Streptomyces sp. DH10]|uniref:hypothetical protein n=1 Tax=Streptomyces sp. DH10 TaxID=3040121 RepID=UPI00244305D6|nr:hypothetical protein [Streptomyces sp. DH10]MDG9712470.1 hypothetical protein [Streptomyces sp. DH10]